MRIVFFSRNEREDKIAQAFADGLRIYAHHVEVQRVQRPTDVNQSGISVAVVVGVKALKWKWDALWESGGRVLYVDKGYFGRGTYWRFSIDTFYPTRYLMHLNAPHDRLEQLRVPWQPMQRNTEGHIVYAGSSEKWSVRFSQTGATEYAEAVIRDLLQRTTRSIVYRPKPSWAEAVPIEGTFFSRPPRTLDQELRGAYCLVTFASNAAVDALVAGIPVIVLGDGVARPLAATSLDQLEELRYPTDEERWQWAANLAYCQWSLQELRSGEAWETISEQLKRY